MLWPASLGRMLRRRARTKAPASTRDWSRRRRRPPSSTVGVAVVGYEEAPRSETILFNLLAGFLGSFSPWSGSPPPGHPRRLGAVPQPQRRRPPHPPLRALPASCFGFGSGTAAPLADDDKLERCLAVPMGVGIGLTFDEAALLIELRDVYWTREGLLSVQLSLGATAILSIAILTGRMLRRRRAPPGAPSGLIPPGLSATLLRFRADLLPASRIHMFVAGRGARAESRLWFACSGPRAVLSPLPEALTRRRWRKLPPPTSRLKTSRPRNRCSARCWLPSRR